MKGVLFGLVFFFSIGLFSQEYSLTQYNVQDGLPSATMFELFQSSQGYIWFGTEGSGVSRFDGSDFIVYNTSNGLSGNTVRSIVEDSKNRLWFATDYGITMYDGLKFRIIQKSNGLTGNIVVSLYVDKNDILWAGCAGQEGGLNKIRIQDDSVLIENYLMKDNVVKNAVFTIVEDTLNTIWAGTFGGGIFHSVMQEDQTKFQPYQGTIMPSNYILSSAITPAGQLLFGTYDRGVFILQPEVEPAMSKIAVLPIVIESNIQRIWDVFVDDNEILLATNEHGLIRYSDKKLIRIDQTNGLPGNQIMKVLRDDRDNLWVSIYDKGVSRFNSESIYRISEKTNELRYNVLFVKNYENILWLGTNNNGLIRYDLLKHSIIEFNSSNSLLTDYISSIDIDKDGNIWVASDHGVYKIFGDKLINITVKDGLINNEVNSIIVDSQNRVWCGTKGGISKIIGNEISNSHEETGLINNEVTSFFEDSKLNIWVGTMNGLAMFTPDDTLHNFDEEEGLLEKRIQTIHQLGNGDLLIGTGGGGIYKGLENGDGYAFSYLEASDLLASKNISFLESAENYLMVGTNKGLTKLSFDPEGQATAMHYNHNTGFDGNKCNLNASTIVENRLFVGTINGVYTLNNIFEKQQFYPIDVQLTNVKLFYKDVDWPSMNFTPMLWSDAPGKLELGYENKNITFEYSAIVFKNPEALEYTSRIKQLENIWPPYSHDKYKQYSDIRPGKYTLQVKARYFGYESNITEYNFIIKPPFWNTAWFRVSAIVFVILLFWFILVQREKNLRKEKIRLDKLVKERTREVVLQKEQIEEKNKNLEVANAEISKKNRVIEENNRQIIDSIEYARYIQNALLPNPDQLETYFRDHFILYMPRDIVSGDFYWHSVQKKKLIFVAADCTGHGVPGAFMSMLGISYLNEIVNEKKILEPNIILKELRQRVISALRQHGDLGDSTGGMDMSVIIFEPDMQSCHFAGAYNDVFLIRNNELNVLKANRMPVGHYPMMKEFTHKKFDLMKGDVIYAFSDGFVDQIGGPKGKRIMKSTFKKILLDQHQKAASDQKLNLANYFRAWKQEEEQLDDVMVIGLKV